MGWQNNHVIVKATSKSKVISRCDMVFPPVKGTPPKGGARVAGGVSINSI